MKNILITGGAGFIGSNLINYILKKDKYRVVCLDNFDNNYDPLIKRDNIKKFTNLDRFILYETDIRDKESVNHIFEKENISIVCHLAAKVGVRPSIIDPYSYVDVNISGSLNLLEISKNNNIEKFVFASSSSVYGDNAKIPFSEIDKTDFPISPYAVSKKAIELLAYTYNKMYGLRCIGLRFFTVYGPGGRPDMAPHIFVDSIHNGRIIKKFGDGTSERDYTYIDDIVGGIIKAIDSDLNYEILNLGNNKPISLNYFISTIEKILSKKAIIDQYPKQPGDVDVTYANIDKAKRLLGYSPTTSIENGLKKYVDWYMKLSSKK